MTTFGGYGFASEFDIERKWREARLFRTAPISNNLVLAQVAQHMLGHAAVLLMSAAERLIAFTRAHKPPAAARHRAVESILDTIAVTAAGFSEDPVRRLDTALGGGGAAPGFARRNMLNSADYALLLGMASHILDYDDVCMLSICHPSAPILSALMAAPVADGVTGVALIDAYCVGVEVMIRLGEAMGFRHYALGFHATSTLGIVGAAAACARLLALNERENRPRIGHRGQQRRRSAA